MRPPAGLYRRLPTEQRNPRTRGLDVRSTAAIVRAFHREDRAVAPAVERASAATARAADLIAAALRAGGRLFFVGAGTSGRLGILEAAECPPTFNTRPSQVQAIMAGGRRAVFAAVEGAEDDAADGARQVSRRVRRGDVVAGVAASGVTPFVRGALRAARRAGCRTILLTSNRRPPAADAEVVIRPAVGPEALTGSTRLKSGTAAKLVLNAMTTAAMVRLGKVYDNLLVDLKPTSRKLRLRAARIVGELTGAGPARSAEWLRRCGGSVKLAVVCLRRGVEPGEGRRLLASARGDLRRAIGEGRAR